MDRPLHDVNVNFRHTSTSRRAISVGIVAVIHLLLVWALVVGLKTGVLQKGMEEIKVAVEKPKLEKLPPPPPPPDLAKPPPPVIPPPEIVIQQPAPTPAITTVLHKVAPAAPAPAISSPVGIGRPHQCGAKNYPETAIRLQEEGTVILSFTVTADGDVANPTVATSSGHADLDQAAIECAGSWKYKPAVQNGQPVAVPWKTQVKWQLPR